MYARLLRFCFGAGNLERARALAEEFGPLIAAQPGCHAVTIFGNEGDGECGVYVLWDTQENADAAAMQVRPMLEKHLGGNLTGPPDARLMKVLWST